MKRACLKFYHQRIMNISEQHVMVKSNKNHMRFKVLFLLTIVSLLSFQANAQRGVRIGYIDTEYILQNVPEYAEATTQLDAKVKKWKSEIEAKLNTIEQQRTDLNNEKALLTKELIEEREEDIFFEEKEVLEYQQKRFGPDGDLMIQKRQLIQPVQDQIFQAVQDLAKAKKYDFVFDKSADVVMLYSAERFDISEQVLRTITRSSRRKQLKSNRDRKEAKEEDVVVEIDDSKDARQEALDKKKAERAALREAKKKEIEAKRAKVLAAREKARQDKIDARNKNKANEGEQITEEEGAENKNSDTDATSKSREEILEERRQKKLAEREARKKELAERRQKILEDRKKAKAEKNSAPEDENQDD